MGWNGSVTIENGFGAKLGLVNFKGRFKITA